MSIENEIQDLTQSTTDLLNAVNTKKVTLDNAVSQAQTAVTDATSQVSLAAAEKVGAQTARDEAESHKNQAYTYSQSAASAVAYQDLTAIAQTKAETAVDVFVYDTSKDSDGGAWRQRTQHTSWYNEPLNTATRGSRKEFPAVAVIVAEANQVTIYDGDDPSLPMWMVFNAGSFANLIFGFNSLSASNGIICSANNSGNANYAGLMVVRFLNDDLIGVRNSTYPDNHNSILGVINRNSSWPQSGSRGLITSGGGLVSALANDVAMTVLPDAPIDPATGLPIPTIAVATDGGVSVIKDDGTVVDSLESRKSRQLAFSGKSMWAQFDGTAQPLRYFEDVSSLSDGFVHTRKFNRIYNDNTSFYPYLGNSNSNLYVTAEKDTDVFVRNPSGFSRMADKEVVVYTTSTYNTGWMNGDIKLATLSDTDDTDLVGSELVTNGTFDTDTSGWTSLSGTNVYDNGTINIQPTDYSGVYQEIAVTAGLTYTVSVEVTATTSGSGRLYIGNGISNKGYYSNASGLEVGTHSRTFTANGGNLFIGLATKEQTGANVNFDNVSVRLAEPDRSVNNNGLQVFGTVQKNPVATGADLVAYGPFSGTQSLIQPFNADLNVGAGDFCYMGWVKTGSTSSQCVLHRSDADDNSWGTETIVQIELSGTFKAGVYGAGFVHPQEVVETPISKVADNNWHYVVFSRVSNTLYLYLDGVLQDTASSTNNITGSSQKTTIGNRPYSARAWGGGSLALWRISGTAPTAEQIKKIYEDEKVLFQENAKATLHGTSDAVTALAYDEDTEILSVGTSSGRSDFRGLRRVNNTTDAVGVAISASNGLIVEE